MVTVIKILFQMIFRLFFTVEYYGIENIPKTGAAVLAGNHPSYLDPALIYAVSERPVRFLAWDKIFTIPLLGFIVRSFGAIPVNLSKKDSNAFEQAMKVLANGDLIALFPEGQRSQQGYMEKLKSGAARMAIFNKCPIVPITITGAYEAWPVTRFLPRLRKITVKFHEPIILDKEECERRSDDHNFFDEITEKWRDIVDTRLVPGLKAQESLNRHFARPASHLRIFEAVPIGAYLILSFPILLFNRISLIWLTLPILAYYGYIVLDILVLKQGRKSKIIRDLASPFLMLSLYPIIVKALAIKVTAFESLVVLTIGICLPYYWTNYYDTQRFLRGLVMTYYLSFAIQILKPAQFGLHWSITVFALGYALYHRSLFWYFQVILIALYGAFVYWIMGDMAIYNHYFYALLAVVVNIYILIFKFTAHDGRVV